MPTTAVLYPKANLTYTPVHFSKNALVKKVPHPQLSDNPDALRYYGDLYVSGAKLLPLEAAGKVPTMVNGVLTYSGAEFELQSPLDSRLKYYLPVFGSNQIQYCQQVLRNFSLQTVARPGNFAYNTATEFVLKGGLAYENAAYYRNGAFFTSHMKDTMQFLTWQPDDKLTDENCPEYLYFLNCFTPVATSIRIQVVVFYEDGSFEELSRSAVNTGANSVYCLPVGFKHLLLDQLVKKVDRYAVYLVNGINERISEIRTFVLDKKYRRNVNYFLFHNSLGGMDTLRCTGEMFLQQTASYESIGRKLPFDYVVPAGESFMVGSETTTEMGVSTGIHTKDYLDYLQELFVSDEIYHVGKEDFMPVERIGKQMRSYDSADDRRGLKLQFRYAFVNQNYSRLKKKYFSQEIKIKLTKSDCGLNNVGSEVEFIVPENMFSSDIDQKTAQDQAQAYADNNAQAFVNANGSCKYIGPTWTNLMSSLRCEQTDAATRTSSNRVIVKTDTNADSATVGYYNNGNDIAVQLIANAFWYFYDNNPTECPLPAAQDTTVYASIEYRNYVYTSNDSFGGQKTAADVYVVFRNASNALVNVSNISVNYTVSGTDVNGPFSSQGATPNLNGVNEYRIEAAAVISDIKYDNTGTLQYSYNKDFTKNAGTGYV